MEWEIILLYLRPPKQNRISFYLHSAAIPNFAETLVRLVYQPPPYTPLPQQYLSKDMQHLNMKSEVDRPLTFEKCPVAFINKNNVGDAGVYYADHSVVVCCAFCVAQTGLWQGGDSFKERRRWNRNCGIIKCLSVGNIPIGFSDQHTTSTEQPTRSRDVCSSFEYGPNLHPERCKYACLYFFFF